MATDREAVRETVTVTGEVSDLTRPPAGAAAVRRAIPRAAVVWSAVTAVLLVAWFFVAWLAMGQNVVDAAGESVGMGFLLLVIVSVVGALRRTRP
jgi:hypothetical protein